MILNSKGERLRLAEELMLQHKKKKGHNLHFKTEWSVLYGTVCKTQQIERI